MPNYLLIRGFSTLMVAVLLTPPAAFAQQRFSAGPRVGVNLANYLGGNGPNSGLAGFTAGAFVMYSSLNHFGISADLLYAQKGGKVQMPDTYKQQINYLDIPIALRYFLKRRGGFRPNLYVGPTISVKLKATQIQEATGIKQDISSQVNALDLGVMAGFQLNFRGIGPHQHILIDGRYTLGLPETFVRPDLNRHNSVLTLVVGYSFGVGPVYGSVRRR